MRIVALALLITACSQEPTPPSNDRGLYAGEGRDRLCRSGDRIGFVTYGDGDANCSVRGRVDPATLAITPDGDPDCRIAFQDQGGSVRLGKGNAACAYYCGPDASFDGKAFTENASASAAVDFAGDPLC